ncbi:MAG: hypothetical protein CFE21_10685 [Bacteroidetes bacterium B1(2017)]|nr:MAG: hypothetical protein CFE21_10685 [Bacteroidetes bacterium B1(2017)]
MKRIILVIAILFALKANAQLSVSPSPKIMALANLRSDPVQFYEIGMMVLADDNLNFQLKFSRRSDYKFEDDGQGGSYYGTYKGVDFVSDLTYLKPGYIFIRTDHKTNTFLLGANAVLGFSQNQLQVSLIDPLLGSITQVTREDVFHKGFEIEAQFLLDLNRYCAMNFSVAAGGSFGQDFVLFKNVYNGAFSNRDAYIPGMGYVPGVYINFGLGLVIKPY